MTHFDMGPEGATQPRQAGTGKLRPNGWRKVSAPLIEADQLAQDGRQADITKTRAVVAAKRVGAHIGLKAADLMLLDTLTAFTQPQDWSAGQHAIVWPSNAFLMEQTGFSLSALKRHARRLAEAGVIAFKDSPNGKRWGRRDADGQIIEAYGFDLSPLSARAVAFEALHAELQAERTLCRQVKRQITVARRMIRARIETAISSALQGPWAHLETLFDNLLARLPRRAVTTHALQQLLGSFTDLKERVETAFLDASNEVEDEGLSGHNTQKLNPTEANIDPHLPTTNQLYSVRSNSSEKEETEKIAASRLTGGPDETALDEWVKEVRKSKTGVDVATIMQACPEFATWARSLGGYQRDWGDLHRAAGQLRPMIGISDHAWNTAQEQLGQQVATAALALVFEKHNTGEVASPGGYLRGMVEKARAGELHLERSFYGRLSGVAA